MRFDKHKIYLDWDNVNEMVRSLANRLSVTRDTGFPRSNVHLVGVARGGLVPAVMLSHLTGFPMTPIHYSTRDNVTRAEFPRELTTILETEYTTVVFIDDICDSGQTFQELYDKCYDIRYDCDVELVSLVEKTISKYRPDYSELCLDDRRWISFPWEKQ